MQQVVPVSRRLLTELRRERCRQKRLHTARLAVWEAQLVTLWCNKDGIILTSSKADKRSILLKALVTCGIRTEAGQSSETVDQSQCLQHSSELKMSDRL